MRLHEAACWDRLRAADHGVLSTVHPERGVDAVPVVFAATDDGRIVIPVDTVKPKSGGRLQRLVNLDADPHCALLVDHYEVDWSQLWWVRVHAGGRETAVDPELVALLADRYPAYRDPGSIDGLILLTPTEVTGWSAA